MSAQPASPESIGTREPLATRLAESGRVPDLLLRMGIRRKCAQRLKDDRKGGTEAVFARQQAWLDGLRTDVVTMEAQPSGQSQQELPAEFFKLCLGKHLKYSACFWDDSTRDLSQAEEKMLRLYCERAELANAGNVLELGCGWGSLTLWMAERYPRLAITAVASSPLQKEFIEARCRERAIFNVEVIVARIDALDLPAAAFDRVVSVEMFEHMRNYQALLARIASWLRPGGKLFVHLFCHRELLSEFEADDQDTLGRHFFSGGLMPAADTLLKFQDQLRVEERWLLPGTHYQKTANAWLENHDANREQVMALMRQTYGLADAARWYQRWRMFWMACAELFGYANGNEWMVAHYRFKR